MKYILLLLVICFYSCMKSGEYMQHPTCYNYYRVDSIWDTEDRLSVDTVYPNYSQPEDSMMPLLHNRACGDDTMIAHTVYPKYGCIGGGWKRITYYLIR